MTRSLAILILILITLAACGGDEATPAPETTQEPAVEPTIVPTEEPTALDEQVVDGEALTSAPWQWVQFTDPSQQIDIGDPQNYVVEFQDDGTVNIKADCNNAMGSYTADGGSMSIEIGPMTSAACRPESRSDQFIQHLGAAVIYFFEGEQLFIDLMMDTGTLQFGVAEEADSAAAAAEGANLYPVVGWQWETITSTDIGRTDITDPGNYRLSIIQDSDIAFISTTECDLFITSTYMVDGSALTFSKDDEWEECGTDPLVDQFVQHVLASANYRLEDGKLIIDLMADGGTMEFSPYDPLASFKVASWDEALQKIVESCGTPGAVLLVDTPSGRLLKATGVARTEDGTPVQVGDPFEIGSNTKSFTTILALQLQEEGVWSLDDPLSQWLPEQAAKIPNGDQVTLRQLGQNTSGFADYANPLIGGSIENNDLEHGYTPEELIDYAVEKGTPPSEPFEPGDGWSYSTTNFVLLGMAIEAVTGNSIAGLYQERIFEPLGMGDSFLLEGVPEPGQIINGYYTSDGQTLNTTAWNGSQGWAGGGNVSTAEDMAKYAEGLAGGDLFQDPSSLEQMLTFVSGSELSSSFTGGYGLGVGAWVVGDTGAWGHEGQSAGFQSWWGVFPDEEATVILLTNSASCSVAGFRTYIAESPDLLESVESET